jgi:nicotinate phosphoribosyltransferase
LPDPSCHSGLVTDLYELTMAAAYFDNRFRATASFELFVRSLPRQRSFLVTAGLDQALEYLENVHFDSADIAYLRSLPVFRHVSHQFFDYLKTFRFSGEVWAMPEGTLAFAEEPLLRVKAPIIEAQIVETYLLSVITFQTMIASKAARTVEAASGRSVVEFGTRRAHGPEAGILAARAAYVGGCIGTSNVAAGRRFGIPVFGTLAHSYVMAYDDEEEAFRKFERLFPDHAVLLVDTYDTLAAIDKIVNAGFRPKSVRLDSGDLLELSKQVRRKLDAGGLRETRIFASSDLDEYKIEALLKAGAPIDAFGVGTALATSYDAPALGGVYKLVDVETGEGPSSRAKFSHEKMTYPGRKQVFRFSSETGEFREDVIGCEDENYDQAEPLLRCEMSGGKRLTATPNLQDIQQKARQQAARLPLKCRGLHAATCYPVSFSSTLKKLLESVRQRMDSTAPRSR